MSCHRTGFGRHRYVFNVGEKTVETSNESNCERKNKWKKCRTPRRGCGRQNRTSYEPLTAHRQRKTTEEPRGITGEPKHNQQRTNTKSTRQGAAAVSGTSNTDRDYLSTTYSSSRSCASLPQRICAFGIHTIHDQNSSKVSDRDRISILDISCDIFGIYQYRYREYSRDISMYRIL